MLAHFALVSIGQKQKYDLREVSGVLLQLGLQFIHESAICASEPFFRSILRRLSIKAEQYSPTWCYGKQSQNTYERHLGRLIKMDGRWAWERKEECGKKSHNITVCAKALLGAIGRLFGHTIVAIALLTDRLFHRRSPRSEAGISVFAAQTLSLLYC